MRYLYVNLKENLGKFFRFMWGGDVIILYYFYSYVCI